MNMFGRLFGGGEAPAPIPPAYEGDLGTQFNTEGKAPETQEEMDRAEKEVLDYLGGNYSIIPSPSGSVKHLVVFDPMGDQLIAEYKTYFLSNGKVMGRIGDKIEEVKINKEDSSY